VDEEEAAQRRQEAFSRSVQGFNSRKNSNNNDDAPFSKEELALMSIRGGAKKVVGTPAGNNSNLNGEDSSRKQQAQ